MDLFLALPGRLPVFHGTKEEKGTTKSEGRAQWGVGERPYVKG